MKNKKCEKCEVIYNGKQCPVCGTVSDSITLENDGKPERKIYKKWWFWAIIIVFVLSFFDAVTSETTAQKNAVIKANSYLEYRTFSRNRLIEQLEFEGFTHEDSVYGVDHCGADWNEQAVIKAKELLSARTFSRNSLISDLKWYKFDDENAVYGADHCDADWNEQAAKAAKQYLEDSEELSRNDLISKLQHDGFTSEQALYGVTENGF